MGQNKDLAEGAGENDALKQKGNFQERPHPIKPIEERFAVALSELIGMCIDAGMGTPQMIPIMEKELAWMRRPFQNPEDN